MITYQKLSIETGVEGPKHDPYSFRILTFENNEKKIELKFGLEEWIKVNGLQYREYNLHATTFTLGSFFEYHTGFQPWQFEKYYDKVKNPKYCPDCGSKKRKWVSGFPGETFTMCGVCDKIIDVDFNIGEVI